MRLNPHLQDNNVSPPSHDGAGKRAVRFSSLRSALNSRALSDLLPLGSGFQFQSRNHVRCNGPDSAHPYVPFVACFSPIDLSESKLTDGTESFDEKGKAYD